MTTFKNELELMNACKDARDWVGEKSLKKAWETCERGDWMLWYYARKYPNNLRELTLAKGHCSNLVRHLMKDERSINAVNAAIAFGEGRISIEQLNAAADAADAAYADAAADAAAAYADAAYAAYAAAYAAYADAAADAAYADAAAYAYAAYADAAYAAYAAAAYADAAYAAYAAAAYAAAADAARKNLLSQCADICRMYLIINH